MDNTSTVILAASSQAGITLTPSLIITSTGAVIGKIVRPTQIGLFGNNISKDMNQRGVSAGSVRIPISCCPSRELELMAPIPAESTEYNE